MKILKSLYVALVCAMTVQSAEAMKKGPEGEENNDANRNHGRLALLENERAFKEKCAKVEAQGKALLQQNPQSANVQGNGVTVQEFIKKDGSKVQEMRGEGVIIQTISIDRYAKKPKNDNAHPGNAAHSFLNEGKIVYGGGKQQQQQLDLDLDRVQLNVNFRTLFHADPENTLGLSDYELKELDDDFVMWKTKLQECRKEHGLSENHNNKNNNNNSFFNENKFVYGGGKQEKKQEEPLSPSFNVESDSEELLTFPAFRLIEDIDPAPLVSGHKQQQQQQQQQQDFQSPSFRLIEELDQAQPQAQAQAQAAQAPANPKEFVYGGEKNELEPSSPSFKKMDEKRKLQEELVQAKQKVNASFSAMMNAASQKGQEGEEIKADLAQARMKLKDCQKKMSAFNQRYTF